MKINFHEVFVTFKKLSDAEKRQSIISFLKNNIVALNKLNNDIGNTLDTNDIEKIANVSSDDYLDIIYELIHIMTEQIEMFSEKISTEFFE